MSNCPDRCDKLVAFLNSYGYIIVYPAAGISMDRFLVLYKVFCHYTYGDEKGNTHLTLDDCLPVFEDYQLRWVTNTKFTDFADGRVLTDVIMGCGDLDIWAPLLGLGCWDTNLSGRSIWSFKERIKFNEGLIA